MKKITKEVSCYSSSLLIKYALEKGIPTALLFENIEEYREILSNPLEWIDTGIWIELAKNFEKSQGIASNSLPEFLQILWLWPVSFLIMWAKQI